MALTKVSFTNPDKMMYPEQGVKKSGVLEYYIRIAPVMLDFLKNRGVVLNRFPDGIHNKGFYEKDSPMGIPSWVKTFKTYSKTAQRQLNYIVCNDLDTLLWIANLAAIEINIPLSTIDAYDTPDLVYFDIDPEPPAGFDEAVEVALMLKEKLDAFHFTSFIKTSGKKGLHIVLPISGNYNFKQTREFVHQFGKHLSRKSDLVVSEFSRSRDPGTVFIDFMQNIKGKTMIAPYSLRAEPGATVSTPLEWMELKKGLRPEEFNIFTVLKRKIRPWDGLFKHRQTLDVG